MKKLIPLSLSFIVLFSASSAFSCEMRKDTSKKNSQKGESSTQIGESRAQLKISTEQDKKISKSERNKKGATRHGQSAMAREHILKHEEQK